MFVTLECGWTEAYDGTTQCKHGCRMLDEGKGMGSDRW